MSCYRCFLNVILVELAVARRGQQTCPAEIPVDRSVVDIVGDIVLLGEPAELVEVARYGLEGLREIVGSVRGFALDVLHRRRQPDRQVVGRLHQEACPAAGRVDPVDVFDPAPGIVDEAALGSGPSADAHRGLVAERHIGERPRAPALVAVFRRFAGRLDAKLQLFGRRCPRHELQQAARACSPRRACPAGLAAPRCARRRTGRGPARARRRSQAPSWSRRAFRRRKSRSSRRRLQR